MTVASEFEVANQQYVATFDKADLPMPPGRYVSPSFHFSLQQSIFRTQQLEDSHDLLI